MSGLIQFNQRVLSLSPLMSLGDKPPGEGYIVLLPAYSRLENAASLLAARSYMTPFCKEYCCVGPMSAELEDEIDAALEDENFLLPTTSFLSAEDACSYFLFAADAGAARYLFAFIADHDDLVGILSRMSN